MVEFSKYVQTNGELRDAFKDLLNWCALADVQVIDSRVDTTRFKIKGKKGYKSSVKFKLGLALFLFSLGPLLIS